MNELPSIELWCHEGHSDKIYQAAIEKSGDGYIVTFAYGRRGLTLNTGTKTPEPLTYAEVQDIYIKLVKSKIAKGYKPTGCVAGSHVEAGGGGSVCTVATAPTAASVGGVRGEWGDITEAERIDTNLRPQLLNPIAEEDAQAYLVSARWCVQEKYDGKRMLVRKTAESKIVAANRKGQRIALPRQVERQLAELPGDFVLDGELVGEVYYVFDLLENSDGDWRHMPYSARLAALQRLCGGMGGNVLTAPTATGRNDKHALFAHLKHADKEGAVFKDLSAPWSEGRPASGGTQLKCKFWSSCSCVVANVNAKRSIEVALDGRGMGNVTIPPNYELPSVGQVVEVKYLYVAGVNGSLYQPVYLGVRGDIDAAECTTLLQRIKYKPVADEAA